MKKYYLLTFIVFFISNLFAETTFLNCDYTTGSKDWSRENTEKIRKQFVLVATSDSKFMQKDLEKGVYIISNNGDLVLNQNRQYVEYKRVRLSIPGPWLYVERDTLNIVANDGDVHGKCMMRTQEEWLIELEEYEAEQTKGNIF